MAWQVNRIAISTMKKEEVPSSMAELPFQAALCV
jgi:hypothetical protein